MAYIKNLEEIKAASKNIDIRDILNWIQPGIKTFISGEEIRTCCIVHGGDGQNLSINMKTHAWQCKSKGCFGTSSIDLYAQIKRYPPENFNQAAEEFAQQFGLRVEYEETKGTSYTRKSRTPQQVIKESSENGFHPYLKRKCLNEWPGLRFGNDERGNPSIIVPFHDIEGNLQTVQFINDSPKKPFLKDFKMLGSFFKVGEINETVYLGEGVATMLTIWEALNKQATIISVGSASNIPHVVKALKDKYKDLEIIICMDDSEAADNAIKRIEPQYRSACSYRLPNFANLQKPINEELADFNDIISKCRSTLEEVKCQLGIEYYPSNKKTQEEVKEEVQAQTTPQKATFHDRLGKLIGDEGFAQQLKGRTYETFEKEHKNLFTKGGLVTGYQEIDEHLYFSKGDFIIAQAMSNHGKSTFMLQLAYNIQSVAENADKNPMCIFITYESMPLRIEEKFINIIGNGCDDGIIVLYDRRTEEKYSYAEVSTHQRTIQTYNRLQADNRINILKRIPLEKIETLIDLYKAEYPDRTIVLFLDYLQIIDTNIQGEGWEKIKKIAYHLEKLAIEKEIIIFSASQVNENRQTREGRDIYNAATTVVDIFNHSHTSLTSNPEMGKLYKAPINNQSVCTFSLFKQKHGPSFELKEYFLFNGYSFKSNKEVRQPQF